MATILLVDDSPDVREVVEELLQLHGHQVQPCISAEAALEHLATRIPDVVIADENLPGISGLQLLRQIRQNPAWQSVRVVICSAADSMRDQARQAGAIDYWLKGSDELFDAVERLDATLRSGK
jgi:two-component system, NtrC family, sensor kinase